MEAKVDLAQAVGKPDNEGRDITTTVGQHPNFERMHRAGLAQVFQRLRLANRIGRDEQSGPVGWRIIGRQYHLVRAIQVIDVREYPHLTRRAQARQKPPGPWH